MSFFTYWTKSSQQPPKECDLPQNWKYISLVLIGSVVLVANISWILTKWIRRKKLKIPYQVENKNEIHSQKEKMEEKEIPEDPAIDKDESETVLEKEPRHNLPLLSLDLNKFELAAPWFPPQLWTESGVNESLSNEIKDEKEPKSEHSAQLDRTLSADKLLEPLESEADRAVGGSEIKLFVNKPMLIVCRMNARENNSRVSDAGAVSEGTIKAYVTKFTDTKECVVDSRELLSEASERPKEVVGDSLEPRETLVDSLEKTNDSKVSNDVNESVDANFVNVNVKVNVKCENIMDENEEEIPQLIPIENIPESDLTPTKKSSILTTNTKITLAETSHGATTNTDRKSLTNMKNSLSNEFDKKSKPVSPLKRRKTNIELRTNYEKKTVEDRGCRSRAASPARIWNGSTQIDRTPFSLTAFNYAGNLETPRRPNINYLRRLTKSSRS